MSEEKEPNCNSVSWCSKSNITKHRNTWAIQNLSYCKSDQIVSSKYDPFGTKKLQWYYRLDPNYVNKDKNVYVRLELVVESCNVPVQLIVRTTVHNTQSSKFAKDKSMKVATGTVISCMCVLRDNFFGGNLVTFCIQVFVVEDYKCQEVPNLHIIEPPSKLLENFTNLHEDKEFSDVKIVVGEQEFDGHKAILAARSPVFRAMFKHEMIEAKQNQVTITDVQPKVFAELLRFIYTDSVKDLDTMALELLQVADKYDLEKLKALCEKALLGGISEETAINMLITADLYRAEQLKQSTIGFIERNGSVMDSEGWKNLWKTNYDLANQTVRKMLMLKRLE